LGFVMKKPDEKSRRKHLPTSRLLILTLLFAARAVAQEHLPNEMPSAVRVESSSVAGYTPAPAPVASLPNAPTPQKVRVIDKKFIAVMAGLGGAESFRFTSRKLVLDNEFAAGAPWVPSVPENQHLVAKYAGIYASELFVAYEMKKPHSWLPGDRIIRKFWWAYPAAMGAIHLKNAIGNVQTQGPGGCTSIECAEQMQMQ
jgi:hypothetical protein